MSLEDKIRDAKVLWERSQFNESEFTERVVRSITEDQATRRHVRRYRHLGEMASAVALVSIAFAGFALYKDEHTTRTVLTAGTRNKAQSMYSQALPIPDDFIVSFTLQPNQSRLTPPPGQTLTEFHVNVEKWSQAYDHADSEVLLLLTSTSSQVFDVEPSNQSGFASGGWYSVPPMNKALSQLGLATIPTKYVPSNWVSVMSASKANGTFVAYTTNRVSKSDWRLVVMALHSTTGKAGAKVLWTKEVSPSN